MVDQTQTYATHVRRPPGLILAALTVLIINAVYYVYLFVRAPGGASAWQIIVAASLIAVGLSIRAHSTRVQDRVIRLEERLRLSSILPEDLRARVNELTPSQLVALRFASDEEVPGLVGRTVAGEFRTAREIKQQVKNWRGDYLRV